MTADVFTHKLCKRDHFTSISDLGCNNHDGRCCMLHCLQVNSGILVTPDPETGDVHSTVNNLFDAVESCLGYLVVFRYMFGQFGDQTTCLP